MANEWINVESSIISGVRWVDGNLYIRFNAGSMYVYYDVHEETYEQLVNAPSKGEFFVSNIKGKYEYSRLI